MPLQAVAEVVVMAWALAAVFVVSMRGSESPPAAGICLTGLIILWLCKCPPSEALAALHMWCMLCRFDAVLREVDPRFPTQDTVFEYCVDPTQHNWISWENKLSSSYRYSACIVL